MRGLFGSLLLFFFLWSAAESTDQAPVVQVYSRNPNEFGKNNTLICHVSGFYPPEISIELLKNMEKIPGSEQTELAFEEGWQYHLTTHVSFTPSKWDMFSCRVTHKNVVNNFSWDPDM